MENFARFLIKSFLLSIFCFGLSVVAAQAQLVVDRTDDSAANSADNCTAAPNDCSLRGAILLANSTAADETITFDATVFAGPVTLSLNIATSGTDGGADEGDLDITDSLTINGTGVANLTIDQTTDDRIFDITAGDTVVITNLTVSGGAENNDGNDGGAIRNLGTLTLTNARVSTSTADGNGGGIYNEGALTIRNTTVFGNSTAGGDGGGIYNTGSATIIASLIAGNSTTGDNNHGGGIYNSGGADVVTIANSTITNNTTGGTSDGGGIYVNLGTVNINNATISDNTANSEGGGIFESGGTVNLRNTIVARNTANGDTSEDVEGDGFVSQGNNLIGINAGAAAAFPNDGPPGPLNSNGDYVGTTATPLNPALGPLANNGGPTETRSIGPTSLAVNNGNNCVVTATCTPNNPPESLPTDQRGLGRVGNVDIGAFELQTPTAASAGIGGRVTNTNGRGIGNVTVTLTGGGLTEPIFRRTSPFGYYKFEGLTVGETYVVSVSSKRFSFSEASRAVSLLDNATDANFVAEPR